MLHQIDFNNDARQVMPTVPTVGDLTKFQVSAQRHGAYESMWRTITFLGIVANTAMWIYV